MARLSDVPTETILKIFSSLHPSSLVGFTCACKRHEEISTKYKVLTQHRELQARLYEVNDYKSSELPKILLEVLNDRRLAWYIRRLVIHRDVDTHPENMWSNQVYIDARYDYSDDDLIQIHDALREISSMSHPMGQPHPNLSALSAAKSDEIAERWDKELHQWMAVIQEGGDGPPKLILAYLATRLEALVWAPNYDITYEDCLGYFVEYLHERLDKIAFMPESKRPDLLRSLTSISLRINNSSFHQSVRPAELASFLTLPALERLEIDTIAPFTDDTEYQWPYPPCSSSVKYLDLGWICFTEGTVYSLVSAVKSLKSLRFDNESGGNFRDTVKLLLERSADTLEVFNFPNIDIRYTIPKLREFTVLKVIALGFLQLFEIPLDHPIMEPHDPYQLFTGRELVDLKTIMPRSLEKLKIRGWGEVSQISQDALASGLHDLVMLRSSTCPNLEMICLGGFAVGCNGELMFESAELREACEREGVALADGADHDICTICGMPPMNDIGDRGTPNHPLINWRCILPPPPE